MNSAISDTRKRDVTNDHGAPKRAKKIKKVGAAAATAEEVEHGGGFVPPRGVSSSTPGPQHFQCKGETQKGRKKTDSTSTAEDGSDEWQTCRESWSELAPVLCSFKKRRVWMPFYYDGVCAGYMRELGFKSVYHKKRDFFSLAKDSSFLSQVDVIIDNPPYTGEETKAKVLGALMATNKPFCMLLPMTILHSALLRDVVGTAKVQAIIPRRVMVRKASNDSGKEGSKNGGEEATAVPFKYLVWLCYRMNLKKDLYFL